MNELKKWLLDYSLPVLDNILPRNQFQHHASLVAAAQYLNGDEVTEENVVISEKLLSEYVAQFRDFYDLEFMTMNFHLLLHLGQVCRNLGAHWNYSCFPEESLNGDILRMCHGTRWAEKQIPASIHMVLGLSDLVGNLEDSEVKDFCCKLLDSTVNSINIQGSVILGKCKPLSELPVNTLNILQAHTLSKKVSTFLSLRRGKYIYTSTLADVTSRDSTVAVLNINNVDQVGLILTFTREYSCICEDYNCHCEGNVSVLIKIFIETKKFETLLPEVFVPNTCAYKLSDEVLLVPVEKLKGTCVKMLFNDTMYVSKPSNSKEWE